MSDTESPPGENNVRYILMPDLKTENENSIFRFGIVIFIYVIMLVSYIYASINLETYTPFTGNIMESPKEAQTRFENYIKQVVINIQESNTENFTVKNEEFKEPTTTSATTSATATATTTATTTTTIFDKMRNYINRFITNIFYVKGNTVAFTS